MRSDYDTVSRAADITFVCGAFKSGTSLVTSKLEENGFVNPAGKTTPFDYGRGLNGRYETRECRVVRNLNRSLIAWLQGTGDGRVGSVQTLSTTSHYLRELPEFAVLKDPQFTSTLHIWLRVAISIGLRPAVAFAVREIREQRAAWEFSPLVGRLLRRHPTALEFMLREQQHQARFCSVNRIPFVVSYYSSRAPSVLSSWSASHRRRNAS